MEVSAESAEATYNQTEEEALKEHQDQILLEIHLEELAAHPVVQHMHGVRFVSTSKGRGRKRKRARVVTLIQCGPVDERDGRWRYWSGDDRTDKGRIPWDDWATQVFGLDFCHRMYYLQAGHASDHLREEFLQILYKCGGRF